MISIFTVLKSYNVSDDINCKYCSHLILNLLLCVFRINLQHKKGNVFFFLKYHRQNVTNYDDNVFFGRNKSISHPGDLRFGSQSSSPPSLSLSKCVIEHVCSSFPRARSEPISSKLMLHHYRPHWKGLGLDNIMSAHPLFLNDSTLENTTSGYDDVSSCLSDCNHLLSASNVPCCFSNVVLPPAIEKSVQTLSLTKCTDNCENTRVFVSKECETPGTSKLCRKSQLPLSSAAFNAAVAFCL